jgi:RNA polymerase sigma factor (sigma-70 family)
VSVRLTADQQELVLRYLPLARRIARRYAAQFARWADDVESAALFGLCRAAARFRADQPGGFAAYARHRIRGEIHDALRSAVLKGFRRDARHQPRVDRLAADRLEAAVIDWAGPVGWELDPLDRVERIARLLPPRYADAVRLHYGCAGHTLDVVARKLGLSRPHVNNMLTQARAWLRQELSVVED